jgi:CRISPR-associated protein Cas5d
MMKSNEVLLRVFGPEACFARPELKVEAVTYEAMTPTAARAILESIYWKPEIKWVIDGIHVLKKINHRSQMTNGLHSVINLRSFMGGNQPYIDITKDRDRYNSTILTNVDYVIKAHFEIVSGTDNAKKHLAMFLRRASRGQYFKKPFFGRRDYIIKGFEPVHQVPSSEISGTLNLGYMLHSINYSTNRPAFFEAKMVDGFIRVPPADSMEVKHDA